MLSAADSKRPVSAGVLLAAALLGARPDGATSGRTSDSGPETSSVTADLAGDGSQTMAVVRRRGSKVLLEVEDSRGGRLASTDVPSPGAGDLALGLSAGSLGSAGAVLAVSAAGNGRECVSLWRFRERSIIALPLVWSGKRVEDCGPAGEWSNRWEREGSDRPAAFVRERSTITPGGVHRRIEVFAFSGFRLERDAGRSRSTIRDVPIPSLFSAELYPRPALDGLAERFDLSRLKTAPRLTIEASPESGVFDLAFHDETGERRWPVVRSAPRAAEAEPGIELTAGSGSGTVRASVGLRNKTIPLEVRIEGAGARFDGVYGPAFDFENDRIEVYPTVEQAIASGVLPGTWASERNERYVVKAAAGNAVVEWGDGRFAVRLRGAPAGSDLVLVPTAGGDASWAIALKGPNALGRRRARCPGAPGTGDCRTDGEGEVLRRLGSAVNVR